MKPLQAFCEKHHCQPRLADGWQLQGLQRMKQWAKKNHGNDGGRAAALKDDREDCSRLRHSNQKIIFEWIDAATEDNSNA